MCVQSVCMIVGGKFWGTAENLAASVWYHRAACNWMAWHAAVGAKSPSVFGIFVNLDDFSPSPHLRYCSFLLESLLSLTSIVMKE